jgi:glycosyltransferase involved in cell wall biosynthesis
MRILIVGLGGVTREFRHWPERILATALARRGHELVAYGYRERTNPLLSAPKEGIDGVLVRRFTPRHLPGPALRRALERDGPFDVVQLFHPRNVLAYGVGRWCRRRGLPTVYTWLGPFHDRYLIQDREQPYQEQPGYHRLIFSRQELLRRLLADLQAGRLGPRTVLDHLRNYWLHAPLAWADALLPCSHHEESVLRRMGLRQPSRVVPLWIDAAYIRELPTQPVEAYSRPLILYVGQLTRRKAYDLLVDAMPAVLARYPAATFLFVTHNPEQRERLLALADTRGVRASIRFLGRLSDAELVAHYRAADLYAFPSRYEGFGLPPLEAMAAGCPVVTSKIPVVSEAVQDGVNGLLTRYDDAADLARGMLKVLGDPALRARLIAAGHATINTRYREDVLVAQVEALYSQLLGRSR